MIVVGLTGSIGMGKSTVTAMFAEEGAAVWSADAAVHRLYAKDGAAVPVLRKEFPEAVKEGAIDREALAKLVLGAPARLRKLEEIVHPLVAEDRRAFLEEARASGATLAVLDIPLLFETGAARAFDAVVVVSAPAEVQRARVLARDGMTPGKFAAIMAQQTPDEEKRARADYVIDTGGPLDETRATVRKVMGALLSR